MVPRNSAIVCERDALFRFANYFMTTVFLRLVVPFEQDYLTAKLHSSQLEKNTKRLRHELAKSRAMNDLLQDEVSGSGSGEKGRGRCRMGFVETL